MPKKNQYPHFEFKWNEQIFFKLCLGTMQVLLKLACLLKPFSFFLKNGNYFQNIFYFGNPKPLLLFLLNGLRFFIHQSLNPWLCIAIEFNYNIELIQETIYIYILTFGFNTLTCAEYFKHYQLGWISPNIFLGNHSLDRFSTDFNDIHFSKLLSLFVMLSSDMLNVLGIPIFENYFVYMISTKPYNTINFISDNPIHSYCR